MVEIYNQGITWNIVERIYFSSRITFSLLTYFRFFLFFIILLPSSWLFVNLLPNKKHIFDVVSLTQTKMNLESYKWWLILFSYRDLFGNITWKSPIKLSWWYFLFFWSFHYPCYISFQVQFHLNTIHWVLNKCLVFPSL